MVNGLAVIEASVTPTKVLAGTAFHTILYKVGVAKALE
jgi:hypothetical protein